MKKKIFSVLLAVVMLFSAVQIAVFATDAEELPLILVAGYSSSKIFLFDDEGNIQEKIWSLNASDIINEIMRKLPGLGIGGIEYAAKKNTKALEKAIGETIKAVFEKMVRNPDGTPKYNTGAWPKKPEESNMEYIYANIENDYVKGALHEKRYTPIVSERLGAENVFQFSVDWRQEAVLCALDLAKYIKAVKEYTGARKVNIFSESHGGQTTGTYLSLCSIVDKGGKAAEDLAELLGLEYGELKNYFDLNDVNNVVMDSPAIGGVQMAYDLVGGNLHVDSTTILEFVESGNNFIVAITGGNEYVTEAEFEWLIAFLTLDNINELLGRVVQNYLLEVVFSLGSFWDLIPYEYYDEVKAMYLTTDELKEAYAPMIEKTDYEHYVVMANYNENLTYARSKGVDANIIVGTDIPTVTGSTVNGDGLIAANTASGAKLSGYGYRFADGYKTDYSDDGITCLDPTHDHVSPKMHIDAAYSYLPENTWFIEGQYHAQYAYDEYALELVNYLLFSDDVADIYSNEDYPQFETTYNAKYAIHAEFDNSIHGTLTKGDTALVVKNVSANSNVKLVSIKVEGMDIDFGNVNGKKIKLGESIVLPFTGEVPDADMKNVTVTFYYLEDNALFSLNSRTFNYTVKGGAPIAFDRDNPLVKASVKPIYISEKDVKNGLSNFDFVTRIKAMVLSVVRVFTMLRNLIQNLTNK